MQGKYGGVGHAGESEGIFETNWPRAFWGWAPEAIELGAHAVLFLPAAGVVQSQLKFVNQAAD